MACPKKGLPWETHDQVAEELSAMNTKALEIARTINSAYTLKSRQSISANNLLKCISGLRFAMEEAAHAQAHPNDPDSKDAAAMYWRKELAG